MKQNQIGLKAKVNNTNKDKVLIMISNNEYHIELNDNIKCAFDNIIETNGIRKIVLPQSIDSIDDFRKYLNIVLSIHKKGKDCFYSELFPNLYELLKLIDISIVLNDEEVTLAIIEEKLKPLISKENCLMILSKYNELQSKQRQRLDSLHCLTSHCINVLGRNLNEIMILSNRSDIKDKDKDELMCLKDSLFNDILSQYFKDHIHHSYDHTNVIQLLMRKRHIENNDIFSLIDEEKAYSITSFEKAIGDSDLLMYTSLHWTLSNCCFKADFYRESEVYLYDSYVIKLYCYYDSLKDEYSVAVQLSPDYNTKWLKEDNICVLTQCTINGNDTCINTNTSLNYFDSNSNGKKLILRLSNITNTLQLGNGNSKIALKVNVAFNHLLPSLMHYISQKFYMYYMLPSITKLSHKSLWIILSSKSLFIRSQDEVLTAILNWIKDKANSNSKEEPLLSLFALIKWKEISVDNLIDLITSYCILLIALPQLESLVKAEFHRRFKAEYTSQESINGNEGYSCSNDSFTNELIDKLINHSLKNGQCLQPITLNKLNEPYSSNTTDNTHNDYCHLEELSNLNQTAKKIKPAVNIVKTESNEMKRHMHSKQKSLSLELNLLTNSSCWVNTSISKRNEPNQLKSQLEIIEKKINKSKSKSKYNKHIRYNTTNKYLNTYTNANTNDNRLFKSPKAQAMKQSQFSPSNQTFIK